MAELEATVFHAMIVVEVGNGLHQWFAGNTVAADGVELSLDRCGEGLLEGFLEQCHLGFEIGGFVGIEG